MAPALRLRQKFPFSRVLGRVPKTQTGLLHVQHRLNSRRLPQPQLPAACADLPKREDTSKNLHLSLFRTYFLDMQRVNSTSDDKSQNSEEGALIICNSNLDSDPS